MLKNKRRGTYELCSVGASPRSAIRGLRIAGGRTGTLVRPFPVSETRKGVASIAGDSLNTAVMSHAFTVSRELLRLSGREQEELHERAGAAAIAEFGRKVFVRAVVEVSNYCRENCVYCGMRRDNKALARHRANPERIADLLLEHRPDSVTDINIQTGEDPVAVREVVLPLIRILRRETNLGISVCLGTMDTSIYAELKEAGATTYIIKFEIGDPRQYAAMQAPGKYDERLEHVRHLAATGWNVSSGFIAGLPGQTDDDLLANFDVAAALPLRGCSVSPFIPGEATPVASAPTGNIDLTLNSMAMLRLMRPDWVIPAVSALNIAGPGSGYRRGLRAGANLVTINMTPDDLREDYLLYKRDRFIMTEERILSAIEAEGFTASAQSLADFYRARHNGAAEPKVALKAA
jgi:biotin synthase